MNVIYWIIDKYRGYRMKRTIRALDRIAKYREEYRAIYPPAGLEVKVHLKAQVNAIEQLNEVAALLESCPSCRAEPPHQTKEIK